MVCSYDFPNKDMEARLGLAFMAGADAKEKIDQQTRTTV